MEPDQPRVTIVVTPRERYGLTATSLESIYEHTAEPFRLVYVAGRPPRSIERYLVDAAQSLGFELITTGHHLPPNRARRIGLDQVDTRYVAFVDNDLIVTDGWLGRLVDCAVETGAALVGPLYFEGDPADRIVHMAGGDYELAGEPGARAFATTHRFQGQPLAEVADAICREPVDFVEFHCMVADVEALEQVGGLDPDLLSTREHLDLCLAVEATGGAVYLEPAAEVTYRTPPPVERSDVGFYLRRWSERWNEASLERFCAKHGIAPSYGERLVGMRARRQLLLEPARRLSARLLPVAADRAAMRILARLEREVNRAVFRLPDRARDGGR